MHGRSDDSPRRKTKQLGKEVICGRGPGGDLVWEIVFRNGEDTQEKPSGMSLQEVVQGVPVYYRL